MSQTPFPEITGLPARVAAIYACAAGAWIALSDSALALAKGQPAAEMWANTGKGLMFVAVTAGLLYVLLRRSLSREAAIRSDLEATQERFTSAVAQLPFTFAIYDADRRFRFLNTRGLLTAHKPLGEVLGRRDEEVFPLELVNAYLPALNRALEKRQPQTEVVDIVLPSGHAHLAYTFTPLLNADGSVRELLAVTNDMTGVVRNDRRVRQLNRTLEAVSAANSVLVRAPDESALLKEFCEVLAERTGHGLVWVGFAETNGPLRVAVRVGNPSGILDIIPLACCDKAVRSFCLPDAALKSAQPTVCRDFLLDDRFAECREWVQSAGMRSGISLPLRTEGKVFGVLSLYAKEPDRFDGEEVKLLAELADDLAFGIVALRQKGEFGQMVERLRQSEEHSRTLKLIIDQSPSVAYVARADAGWQVEFMSGNIAHFGYQAAEFISGQRSIATIIHREDLPELVATVDKAVANGKAELTVEYRVFDALGQTRRVQDSSVMVRNASGAVTHFRGVLTDITDQRRTAEVLGATYSRYHRLMEQAEDGIALVDVNGRFVEANPAACRLYGRPWEKLMEMSLADTYAPEDRHLLPARLLAARDGEPFRTERKVVRPDGTTVDVEVSWGPVEGILVQGILRDVTEHKRSAESLTLFRALVDRSGDGVEVIDPETGRFLDVNEMTCLASGYTREELLALSVPDVEVESLDRSSWPSMVEEIRNTGSKVVEGRHRRKDGSTFPVEVSVRLIRLNRDYLIAVVRDITERRRAEQQLRLQGAALAAAANAIVITNALGTIEWANAAFTKSTGYSLAEAVGQNPRLLKSGKHPREFYEGMWKTILGGHVWHGEMHNRRKDGTVLDEEMTIAPVRDAAGCITHFIAIKQDITERKSLEKQFLRAQRLEGIGLLAGGIAHDLNNVLAPILMGADLLKLVSRDEQTIHQLDGIVQSARRGADIVKQVLTFARGIEGERVVLHPKHVIKEMVRMARETFPRNIALSADIPGDLWPVVGDATQLHQVLLNLSVNARDALNEGGDLSYSAANVEVDDALAQANPGAKPGPHVVLRIKDTGTGIPPEVLDRVFEPFFTTKELGQGTGLGLSTVIGIVRSHGGFVTVSSQVGRGTTFEVYLPASPEAAGQLAAAQPEPPPRGNGELVLVVDDEASILQITRRMLEAHGYRVLTADDGTTALTQMSQRAGEVALVITDVMMPFMDGVQLIRALRKLSPEVKVIASSGALGMPGQKDRTDEVLALGVKHILHKPYSVAALLRMMHEELYPDAPKI
jgi:PAS domain S-box-containing protein